MFLGRLDWIRKERQGKTTTGYLAPNETRMQKYVYVPYMRLLSSERERVNEIKIELNKRMKKERERKRKIEKKRVGKPTIRL